MRPKANGKMAPPEIRKHCRLDRDAESLLKTAMEELGLSARAHDKILRVGRTIADLDGSDPHRVRAFQRSDQLPHARPAVLGVTSVTENAVGPIRKEHG